MKKDRDLKSTARRDFLKVAGFGTLAGATAAVGASRPAEATVASANVKRGYQETEHVKKFYSLARF